MKTSPRIIIGIITFCNDETPLRFEIMKKALPSLAKIKSEGVYFTLWDNNSTPEVREFLDSLDFVDFKYYSNSNYYDVAPVQFLCSAAKLLNADYVCHMEDDLLVCNDSPYQDITALMGWMDKNKNVGGTRILRWELNNIEKYNKRGNHPQLDRANMQTHLNVVTGENLNIDPIELFDLDTEEKVCNVAKTNWHWYNFPIICKTNVYQDIVPKKDIEPLQVQEGYMMRSYADTNLLLGAHDGGIVTHLAPPVPNSKTSVRHHMMRKFKKMKDKPSNMGQEIPVIKMKDVLEEVEKAIKRLEEEND